MLVIGRRWMWLDRVLEVAELGLGQQIHVGEVLAEILRILGRQRLAFTARHRHRTLRWPLHKERRV